jgi:hypothetical protein
MGRASSLDASAGVRSLRLRRSGRRTDSASLAYGSTSWGIAIAFTKCSWKRGSTAVSIFSTRPDDVLDLGARAAVQQRDTRPGPCGVARRRHALGVAVGDEPEDERVHRVDVRPERAGESDPIDPLDPVVLHEQRAAGVERSLGELDLAHVVLRDHELGLAAPEDVRERAPVRDDPRGALGERAVDGPVRRQHTREVELRDRLDDPGPADTRDLGLGEPGLVRPRVVPDHAETRLERLGIDAHRSTAPGAARCPQEICAPSKAGPVGLDAARRRSRFPSTISAFVPTSTTRLTSSCRCGASERALPPCPRRRDPRCREDVARAPGWTGMPTSRAGRRTASSTVSENGAAPRASGRCRAGGDA